MPVRSIHSNIKSELIECLKTAKFSIYVAVAWFSDEDIFNILCKKAIQDVKVELIIHDDYDEPNSINFSKSGLDFPILHFAGANIYLLKGHHNKYCIIDEEIYISGSYNWTYKASLKKDGFEGLEIHNNANLAIEKMAVFCKIKNQSVRYVDLFSELPLPKIDVYSFIVWDITPMSRHFYIVRSSDPAGVKHLMFYVSTNFNDERNGPRYESTTIFRVHECGETYISKGAYLKVFQGALWLLAKEQKVKDYKLLK